MSERRNKNRNNENRRDKRRIYADLNVTTYIEDQEYITKMRNISGNGMQIVEPADAEIQISQDCKILIQDDNTSIILEALVVWVDGGLIGICFKKQDQSIQKQLNKLSERLLVTAVTDVDMANLI